jgi:oligoribonuclease
MKAKMSVEVKQNNIVWMDLEMTGLNPDVDQIIEIATIITDENLNILAEGPNDTIKAPQKLLEGMDEWNTTHHKKSGLYDRVLSSQINLEDAEKRTLNFIKEWTVKDKNPLAGNSISQDRRFLYKYMPKIIGQLHYRNIDVSSIKELQNRWWPQLPHFQKSDSHRALDDIIESIEELRYYKKTIFKK